MLKEGAIYQNARGDFFGPMVRISKDWWNDQYGTGYHATGVMLNHTNDSQANLIVEVIIADVCNAHNKLTEALAALPLKGQVVVPVERRVGQRRVRQDFETAMKYIDTGKRKQPFDRRAEPLSTANDGQR